MAKRYPHYWWPVTGCRYPSKIAVLDCDSNLAPDDTGNRVQIEQMTRWQLASVRLSGGCEVRRTSSHGGSASSCWDAIAHLLSSNDRTWLFCSPSSRILPMIGFWDKVESEQVTFAGTDRRAAGAQSQSGKVATDGICVLEDPPTVIVCRVAGRKGSLCICDVRNWGIELLPSGDTAHARVERYISGLLSCVSALRAFGPVSLRCTAGSQAVQALRTDPDCVRLHCHASAPVLALERASYFGGRCEAFRIGEIEGPVYHVDVRSMYPAICRTLPIPVSLRAYHDRPDEASAAVRDNPTLCAAHVRIRTDVPRWPYRREGDIIYPTGEFDTHLAGPDLSAAISAGAVIKVYSAAEYSCAPVLSAFMTRWLAVLAGCRERQEAMAVAYCKRVMNALPGKFGEPGRRWIASDLVSPDGPNARWMERHEDGIWHRYRSIGGFVQREEIAGESYWSCPAIAAWITAQGRVRLWDYIKAAGRENVWYTDTDSLICGSAGISRLLRGGHIRDGETGHLRLVGQHSRCSVYGIRHYVIDDTVSCAGVPRGTIEPGETREQYWLRRRSIDAAVVGRAPAAERERMRYPAAGEYRHGRVMADGRVIPWEIGKDEKPQVRML